MSKAEQMRALQQARKAEGLVRVYAYVLPEHKERLSRFVEDELGGLCPVRGRRRSGALTGSQEPDHPDLFE